MARRRANNEGSFYQRKDGRWVAAISIDGRRVYHYGDTQGEVREWAKEKLTQVDKGLTYDATKITVKEFLDDWLKAIHNSISYKSYRQYEAKCRLHIIPYIGKIKLSELRPDQIQKMYNKELETTSEHNVEMVHVVLRRALKVAAKQGLIFRNPTDGVEQPHKESEEFTTLSEDQVRSLLSAVKGDPYEALYYLAIETGIRQGAILGLKWSDLDWRNRFIMVQRQVQRTDQGIIFKEPKTKKSRRRIELSDLMIEKLRKHLDVIDTMRSFAGKRWQEHDMIFPSSIGTPYEARNLLRRFKTALKKAGLPDIRFHDLRHTAATLMLQRGVHPKIVQERLGHSTITITLDTYSHVTPTMQRAAAESLSEIFLPIDVTEELK